MFDGPSGAQVAQEAVNGILQRIDSLSVKLGTTAAHIWDVYVGQARVEGIRDAIFSGFFLILAVTAASRIKWAYTKLDEHDEERWVLAIFGIVALSFIGVLVGLIYGYSSIGELLNPQYWAFQHLTQDLKNLF